MSGGDGHEHEPRQTPNGLCRGMAVIDMTTGEHGGLAWYPTKGWCITYPSRDGEWADTAIPVNPDNLRKYDHTRDGRLKP